MQVIEKLPLAKRAGRELTAPEVAIARNLRDEPTTPVVPKHEPLVAALREVHGAAPARFAIQLAAFLPERGLEPAGRCVAGPGGVI